MKTNEYSYNHIYSIEQVINLIIFVDFNQYIRVLTKLLLKIDIAVSNAAGPQHFELNTSASAIPQPQTVHTGSAGPPASIIFCQGNAHSAVVEPVENSSVGVTFAAGMNPSAKKEISHYAIMPCKIY